MNSKRYIKNGILLIFMTVLFNTLHAQDTITFTWRNTHGALLGVNEDLIIRATNDQEFTINWGDGTIETKTGLGNNDIPLFHNSYEYEEYTVTIAASDTNCKFTYFYCRARRANDVPTFCITNLVLHDCSDLEYLDCVLNGLHLSDLYAAHLVINDPNGKIFDIQYLLYQPLTGGVTVDFSSQRIFGGIETVFKVWKNGIPAILNDDYSNNNGIITFIKEGIYHVEMTNDAIVTHPNYPAVVIAGVDLTSIGIPENSLPNLKIYPNPTNDVVYIKTENETTPELKLYSLDGKLLQQIRNTEIDLSDYSHGLYVLKIDGRAVKIMKK